MVNRNRTVDIIRGISILAIIFGHLGVDMIARVVFTFHVPIFFIITGYYIKPSEFLPFLRKKTYSLLVPYIITCLVMAGIAIIIAFFKHADCAYAFTRWIRAGFYGAGSYYKLPEMFEPVGAIWFILASFWSTLLFQICLKWKPIFRILWVCLIFLIGYYTPKWLFWFPFSVQAGCCAVLFLYIGYCVHLCIRTLKELEMEVRMAANLLFFAVWIGFICTFKTFSFVSCNFGRGIVDIIGSVAGSYCIYVIGTLINRNLKLISKYLEFLGRNSLTVLCVHITEMNMIEWRQIIRALELRSSLPWIICCGIAVSCKLFLIICTTASIVTFKERFRVTQKMV